MMGVKLLLLLLLVKVMGQISIVAVCDEQCGRVALLIST